MHIFRQSQALQYALLSISLLLFSTASLANIVTLKNGSVLIGGIVSKQEDKLVMSTSFAGEIRISWDDIARIKVHQPIEVHTVDGELIETLLIIDEVDAQEPADGPLITLEGVDEPLPAEPEYVASDDVSILKPEPWELGIGSKFTGVVDFGLQFNTGNTETESVAASTDLQWKRVDDRWSVGANYFREEATNVTTADNWFIRANYDYFITDTWYAGVSGQFDRDRIANLDRRLNAGPLIGHQFWESDETNLSSEVGIVYVDEKFDYPDDTPEEDVRDDSSYTGLRWNLKYDRYTFKDIIQIYYENELLLDASDVTDETRAIFRAVTGARVFLIENLSAGAEFQYDYDGSAAGSVKKEDTRTVIKLGYSW
jgi:putative salt-induced outer membrane protein YdiY